jgi:hypothetical protein
LQNDPDDSHSSGEENNHDNKLREQVRRCGAATRVHAMAQVSQVYVRVLVSHLYVSRLSATTVRSLPSHLYTE